MRLTCFLFQVNEFYNDDTMLHLIFSEYWNGDGEDEENHGFAKDNDEGEVVKIAKNLEPILGDIFTIKAQFESW